MRDTLTYARSLASAVGRRVAATFADARARAKAEPDAGYTTETVVVTALVVIGAIAALGALMAKVMDKVNGISF
ncbi:hypothetical protein [Kitasatospora sp. LaBMicrA B282]|uniref:hypothetical protein n=1 Tax=Kitasatospora sp. LaBMicrA B282 TaxID=3420949 RepID=UPI003D0D11FE